MTRTELSRTIDAPVGTVFLTVADISNFSKAVPHIEHVEFLSETRTGVGARFRETRLMGSRRATTELEVTEYVQDERVRFVSDAGGTVWDTTFTVEPDPDGRGTRLVMVMEARPHKLLARLATPLMKRVIARAIEADLDAVKAYAEAAG
ncbi:MAG: SRPBCC family protein [Gemmatimonadota bacterium]|uniref:SRPBCC family protein n=1 Tax=Candidatus Palauibacter scopulicola TaxID=3056741 RepID=UPI00238CABDC|nr:SRPBCC family protein [Candidatus Palauibacter scopulicola]MDE2662031.1 SRPBCC family protein [Candidatus Palauibacter scopulicola]